MELVTQARKIDGLTAIQILQVRGHLEEILASHAFAGSKRAQDFLHLIVGHALEGDFDSLRERMIGAEMFGRPIDYDTGSDSVVRVKATEVRKKLAQYYLEGRRAGVKIELPSGSYVPRFLFDEAEDTPRHELGLTASTMPQAKVERPPELLPLVQNDVALETEGLTLAASEDTRAPHIPSSRRLLIGLGIGFLIVVIAGYFGFRRWYASTDAALTMRSIAILPLENHSGVPAQEYFADGMTRELIGDLGPASDFRVAPAAAVTSYKGTRKTVPEIAHELSVDGIVEGSAVREGNLVLVSVWFTDARTNRPVWAHTYIRDLTTALAWQGEVAQAIAKQITLSVKPQAQLRFRDNRAVDPVAEDLFQHGKYLLEAEDCVNAADYFRAALNVSFNYPQAQAALASCDGHLGETDRVDPIDSFSMEEREAAKAVELDDSLAEGHAEMANAAINLNWDWATAATEFRRAMQLNPRSASIHEEYERYLVRTGRVRETLTEMQKSEGLDPFSSRLFHLQGSILYYCRQYDQALLVIDKVRTLDIPQPNWHFLLGEIYAEKGAYNDSIAEFSRAGIRPQAVGHLGNVYARAGKTGAALELIPHLEDTVKNEGIGRYDIALIYVGLGKKEEAFKWLEEAYKAHDEGLTYLKIDPCFDPLHSDPRFGDLLGRLGLAQ